MSQYPYDTPLRANEPVAAVDTTGCRSSECKTMQTDGDRHAFARFVARALVNAFARGVYLPSPRIRRTIALIWRLQGRAS